MLQYQYSLFSLVTLSTVLLLSGCNNTPHPTEISYSKHIKPILAQRCLECHDAQGAGSIASGLQLSTYDKLIKGTKFGPIIKPGDSLSSTLMILVEGRADSTINMPHGDRPPLTSEQIKTLRQWINQGAKNN